MFLAIQEIKKNKLRYGLVTLVIVMIAYLIFILTALATGLSDASKQAVDSWHASQMVLNADANGSLSQSNLTARQAQPDADNHARATVVQMDANVQSQHSPKVSAQVLGIDPHQFIYHDLTIVHGRKFTHNREIVVDQSLFQTRGYHLGQWVRFTRNGQSFKIVGTIKNTTLNVAPVIYANTHAVQMAKWGQPHVHNVSALIYRRQPRNIASGTQVFKIADFIQNIPGYSAQNTTFSFMIVFLLLITLAVVAIFLYVLTMQKIPYFAVMKIQGIGNGYLSWNVISTALLLTVGGIIFSGLLTWGTALAMPAAVPMTFDLSWMGMVVVLLMLMAVMGALIPMRMVAKVDPAIAMGGY